MEHICMYVWVKEHWVAEFFTHRCYLYTYYTVSFFFLCLLLCFQWSTFLFAPFSLLFRSYGHTYLRCWKWLFFLFSSCVNPHHSIDTHPSPNHYPSSNRTNVKSGVSALSSTSTAFGTAASNNRLDHAGNGHIDEALRQQALAEEEAAMNQYKVLKDFLFEDHMWNTW